MDHAKKMMLVEERQYDELWKRPTIDASKSYLSNKLQAGLTSNEEPDDVKAKNYQQNLNRYLNQKQHLAVEVPKIAKWEEIKTEVRTPQKKAKRRRREVTPSQDVTQRRPKRVTKIPVRWTGLDE